MKTLVGFPSPTLPFLRATTGSTRPSQVLMGRPHAPTLGTLLPARLYSTRLTGSLIAAVTSPLFAAFRTAVAYGDSCIDPG